jgi:hyperosmotically inducible periplasmic protein
MYLFCKKDLNMNKLIPLMVSSVLMIGAVSCENTAKTSADAPGDTKQTAVVPDAKSAQNTQDDATNATRKAQIESDIRAREQRSNMTGGDTIRDNKDLQSEVRGKLEANLPASKLTVDAKDGAVTVAGTVPTAAQLNKIKPLAMEIKGVKNVTNKVAVAPAK